MPWVDMTFPQASVRCVWITLHSVLTRGCSLCWMSWMHLRGDHTWLDAFGSGLSQGISDENAVRNILHLCSKAEAVSAVHVSELRAIAPLKSCCESKSLARWPRLHMIRGNDSREWRGEFGLDTKAQCVPVPARSNAKRCVLPGLPSHNAVGPLAELHLV